MALVAIIGAGPAGLACAHHCLQQGLDVLVLEQSDHIGGLWWFDEKKTVPSVLPSLTANTKARELEFPGFPFQCKGDYPTASEYCLYLQDFAAKTDIVDSVRFNALVEKVVPSQDDPRRWSVQITDTAIRVPMAFEADYVAVCNGHYRNPRVLDESIIPGLESFSGSQMHSSAFKDPYALAQKNVLVVGMGASGVEILHQISDLAQEVVACSMRMTAGPPKSPRNVFGSLKKAVLSPRAAKYGMDAVSSVRPAIRSIKKGEVTFVDGSTFKPDTIVWCTGYVYSFPFLSNSVIEPKEGRVELYQHMFPLSVEDDTLAVIGLPSVNGTESVVALINEQSSLYAKLAAGKCKLPSRKQREQWINLKRRNWTPFMYRPLQVDFKTYVSDLHAITGVQAVIVQENSFLNTAVVSSEDSGESSMESEEEGEDFSEEEEEDDESESETNSKKVMKTVSPRVANVTKAADNSASVADVAPKKPAEQPKAAVESSQPAAAAQPSKKLVKSEGMVLGKQMPLSAVPTNTPAQSAPSTPPPASPKSKGPQPLASRTNTSNSLESSKTGVFASFKRTPTKSDASGGILNRLIGEKRTPYPPDLLIKRQAMVRASLYPLMVCVPTSAACGEIGKRELMEDTHVLLDRIPGVPEHIPSGFWAVYDGHGGQEVSRMAEQLLHVRFQKMLVNALIIEGKSVKEIDVDRMLRRCFKETDRVISQKLADLGNGNVGSTAAVAVLLGRRLFCANTGDSEVIVAVKWLDDKPTSAVEMSHKHKPRDEREKSRIETLGGMVFGGRVYGTLAVARGLGDTQFKPPTNPQYIISPDPDVKMVEMAPQHRFLILACDGLWDKVTHEEAAEFVYMLRENGYSVEECAQWLVKEADDRISRDNITVVVVDLQWSIEAGLTDPKTCPECKAVTFGMTYCTKCGLPWGEVDPVLRQAPSVRGKRAKNYRPKKLTSTMEEVEETEFVIGTPTEVQHTKHAQTVEEMQKILQ